MNNPPRAMGSIINHTPKGNIDVTPTRPPAAFPRSLANSIDPDNERLALGVTEARQNAHRALVSIAGEAAAAAASEAAACAWAASNAGYRVLLQRTDGYAVRPLPASSYLITATEFAFATFTEGAALGDPEIAALAGLRAYHAVEYLDCATVDRACIIAAAVAAGYAAATVVATRVAAKPSAAAKAARSEPA